MKLTHAFPVLALVVLVFGIACSGSDGDDNGSTGSSGGTTPTQAPDGGAQPTETPVDSGASFSLEETQVRAALDVHYKTPPGGPAPEGELPFAPGSVQARWYSSGDRFVVHYEGLALDGPAYCPGNSLAANNSFQFISNSPAVSGACEGATTLPSEDSAGVYLCDGQVLYKTEIPSDSAGDLFGTIEIFNPDGTIVGLTSVSATSLGVAPAVDLSACEGPLR